MLIEIFSDLSCPWCYIGSRRLSRALAERPRLAPRLFWHPILLNHDLPPSGIDRNVYLTLRFGSRERARQALAAVEETARRDGLPLNLGRITRMPNTVDAHRLVTLAQSMGIADRLIEALFGAYFVDGRDIGDHDVLLDLAATNGLTPDQARQTLTAASDPALALFRTTARNHQIDLYPVPYFIFNQRFVLAGAQEPVTFLPLLDLAASDSEVIA